MPPVEDIVRELRGAVQRPVADRSIIGELQSAVHSPVPPPSVPRDERPVVPLLEHPLDAFAPQLFPPSRRRWWLGAVALAPWIIGAGIVVTGLLYVSQYGLRTKGRVIERGNAAIARMVAAKEDAERMDWAGAERELRQAQESLDAASSEMHVLGPAAIAVLGRIPGLGALRTGSDLLEAGRLITAAGLDVSGGIATLTGLGNTADRPGAKGISLAEAFPALRSAFASAGDKLTSAADLLDGVASDDLPGDVQSQVDPLRERLPAIRDMVVQGAAAVEFLQRFTGDGRARRYLVLFQNSSELRPTGGFPGSYGILTMQDGRVTDWRADDIYNPDGQIRDLIVPPRQLQHITPGWGMRDANWFVDFSVSARKAAELWRRGGGTTVDGVIAIRPDILKLLLEATGPISLDGYDTIITADNFLPTLQSQVEADRPTGTPKRIIADLAPVVLDRLASLPGDRWMALMAGLHTALDRRDVLLWFDDEQLQRYADDNRWSGRVLGTDGDYVMVTIANVGGAKADAVTATSVKLETRLQDGSLVHRLTLTRRNDGNASPYGFYNKTNRSYVRVLSPKGSTLRGISGNAHPKHRPLIDYAAVTSVRDPDLEALEATERYDAAWDATTSEESGKTAFGFWMEVPPGQTQSVQLEYAVPAAASGNPYRLYVQRQPGLDLTSLEVTLDKPDLMVGESSPILVEWPDSWRLHGTLDRDLQLEAVLR